MGNRGCTQTLQRVVTDLGLDHSFSKAAAKLKEHYGFELPVSSLRKVALNQAKGLAQRASAEASNRPNCLPAEGVKQLIAEADGSMVPIVSFEGKGKDKDRRKRRKVNYREARLAVCQAQGASQSFYAATLGSPEELGSAWRALAKQAGRGLNSFVHVVCDGAVWIEKQACEQLQPDRQVVDFFHVCEYLEAARETCARNPRGMGTQKNRLRKNRSQLVIEELSNHLEAEHLPDEHAPVRCAYRYLSNRTSQLDYKGSREDGLPTGSGLIESGHKHLIQARMKIAGASWLEPNAEAFIKARIHRANGKWEEFWKN